MKVSTLILVVTIIGSIAFLISLLIVILGKKVGESGGRKQQIKIGEWVNVGTNSVLALVIITAAVALAPLALTFWKPFVVADAYSRILITGMVLDEHQSPADNVDINIIRSYDGSYDTIRWTTGMQGNFTIPLKNAKPDENYEIICSKTGYQITRVSFGFNVIPFPITLLKKGGEE